MTATFYEDTDTQGRTVVRLNRRNGRILARWRDDMPGQTPGRYQWVRERKAVYAGLGDLCYSAIQCALYANGLSDFSPALHSPELGYRYVAQERYAPEPNPTANLEPVNVWDDDAEEWTTGEFCADYSEWPYVLCYFWGDSKPIARARYYDSRMAPWKNLDTGILYDDLDTLCWSAAA